MMNSQRPGLELLAHTHLAQHLDKASAHRNYTSFYYLDVLMNASCDNMSVTVSLAEGRATELDKGLSSAVRQTLDRPLRSRKTTSKGVADGPTR